MVDAVELPVAIVLNYAADVVLPRASVHHGRHGPVICYHFEEVQFVGDETAKSNERSGDRCFQIAFFWRTADCAHLSQVKSAIRAALIGFVAFRIAGSLHVCGSPSAEAGYSASVSSGTLLTANHSSKLQVSPPVHPLLSFVRQSMPSWTLSRTLVDLLIIIWASIIPTTLIAQHAPHLPCFRTADNTFSSRLKRIEKIKPFVLGPRISSRVIHSPVDLQRNEIQVFAE